MGLTFRRFLNPCEHPVPVPGDTLAEVWGNKKSRCGGGHGHCDLPPSCRARPSPRRLFSITGNTWPPFLPITLTLPSRAPQLCQGYCTIFFPSQGLCFCRTSNSPDVVAQSTEHIPETLAFHPFPLPGASDGAQHENVPARGRKQRSEMWSCKSASSGCFWGQLCLQHCSGDSSALVTGDFAAGPP